jgi:hypothetical protein
MNFNYSRNPSKYELFYLKWNGIGYDKDKLILFIKRYKWLKFISFFLPSYKEEFQILNDILSSHDSSKLELLLNNDEKYSKIATLEKLARIASIDILLTGVFSRDVFEKIHNLPLKDYQLFTKRTEELINTAKKISTQSDNISKETSGL